LAEECGGDAGGVGSVESVQEAEGAIGKGICQQAAA